MARPPSKQPTDGELEILKILWETGPAGLGQIHAVLQERRGVAITTVATMLKMMLAKEMVEREDGPRGYLWSARVSRKAAVSGLARQACPTRVRRLSSPAGRPPDRGGRPRRPRAQGNHRDLEIPAGQDKKPSSEKKGTSS